MKQAKSILAIIAVIIVANSVFMAWKCRLDTTAEKRFTLTAETRRLLKELKVPITADVYVSRSVSGVPPSLQSYCDYVNELLDEYRRHADGKLVIHRHDPIPGSAAEEQAMRSGMIFEELRKGDTASRFCMGICFRRLGSQDISIRQLNPAAQNGLEYDITRALLRIADEKLVTVGVMSRMPVFGGVDAEQKHQLPEWATLTALRDCSYDIRQLPDQFDAVPEAMDILLLIHPEDLEARTQRALDSFIQRGGRLLAFVDPACWSDMMLGGNSRKNIAISASSLGDLAAAWGISETKDKVILDRSLATIVLNRQSVPENHIEWLSLTGQCLSRDHDITAFLSHVETFMSGQLTWKDTPGIRITPLLATDKGAQLVDSLKAFRHQRQLENDFAPDGVHYCLALCAEGELPSAFDKNRKSRATRVILFADADLMHDNFTKGRKSDNLQLFLNCMDGLRMSDEGLLGLRNRSYVNRSLTRLEERQNDARKEYQKRLDGFQKERDQLASEIRTLETSSSSGMFSDVEGEKLRGMYDRVMDADRELRGLQVKANKAMESVRQRIILWNLLLGPGLLMLILLVRSYVSLWRSSWKRALRTTAWVIVCLAVAVCLLRIGGRKEEISTAVRGDMRLLSSPLNRDGLAAIEVVSPNGMVLLKREGDRWVLPNKHDFPADSRMLGQFLESVAVCTGEPQDIPADRLNAVSLAPPDICTVSLNYGDGSSVRLGFGNWKRNYLNEYQGRYLMNDQAKPMLSGYQFQEIGQPEARWLAKSLPGFGPKAKRLVRVSEFKELGWCLEKRLGGYEIQGKIPRGFTANPTVVKNIVDNFLYLKILDVTDALEDFRPEINLQLIGDDDILYDYALGSVGSRWYARLKDARSVPRAGEAKKILESYGRFYMEINGKLARAFQRNRKELLMFAK